MREETGDGDRMMDARVLRTRNDVLRTALQVAIEQGWEAVTHPKIAMLAGYSRATLYNHWPSRTDLLRDAFLRLGDIPHPVPTGELRADLIAELISFRDAMRDRQLDRALAVLVDLAASDPAMQEVRDRVVGDGERAVRDLLKPVAARKRVDVATLMLCGTLIQTALLHGREPKDREIAEAVDTVLAGLLANASPAAHPVHR